MIIGSGHEKVCRWDTNASSIPNLFGGPDMSEMIIEYEDEEATVYTNGLSLGTN